ISGGSQDFLLVPEADAGRIGDAWPDGMDEGPPLGIGFNPFADLGPRPDQRHLSPEHIPELRQFIQLVFAEEPPNGCDPARGPGIESSRILRLAPCILPLALCALRFAPLALPFAL